MTPFSRLFRKAAAPIPPTVDERIAMLDMGSSDLILGIALGSHEEALRVAAIRKLPDGEALRGLAGLITPAKGVVGAVPAVLEQAARVRLAELIETGSVDFTKLCASCGHNTALLAVAAQSTNPDRLGQVLASIQDPVHISRLVLEGPSSRIRQFAAECVQDPAQLRQLLKQVRDKDKSVYKILRQKSEALSAKEKKEAQLGGEITAACASLELHSHRIYDAHYASTLEQLKARWSSLAGRPAVDIATRAVEAADRCHEVIAVHIRMAAQLAAQREVERAAAQAAEDVREHERQAAREAASAQAEAEAQFRREAAAIREAEEAALAIKIETEEHFFRQVGGLIRQAKGALEEGNTQRASGLRRAVEEKLPNASALPVHLTRSLLQLDERLKELEQWKDYAVAPKRIELIEEMETLIGSTDEPRILADRIKALQEEWRTISRGLVSEAPEEWQRFHRASQAAYQPCKVFFETQAKLRQENLEHRTKVLERLAAFEMSQNVDHPDWRLMASVLREAPLEWRRYQPVDREFGRAVQQDFDAAMARLQSRLGAWKESNAADKQALIKRARQLLDQEDSREAIDAVKRLQTAWKEIGQGPRDQDQPLWNEFRELCDGVYRRRQQAYADYAAGLQASKAKALVLCEEAERAGELTGPALLEMAGKVPEWREAFNALDEMPRLEARDLKVRFERALDLCLSRTADQHAREANMSFTNLIEAGRHVCTYEWALMVNDVPAEHEAFKQAARTFIESVPRWPKGGLQTVKDALAKAESTPGADVDAREKALRILCIRSEIECETPSPVEDDALRREYQVQRLTQQMGQGIHSSDGDWEARGLEWVRIGAVPPLLHDALQKRFLRCWNMRQLDTARPPFRRDHGASDRGGPPNRAGQGRGNGRDRSKPSPRR